MTCYEYELSHAFPALSPFQSKVEASFYGMLKRWGELKGRSCNKHLLRQHNIKIQEYPRYYGWLRNPAPSWMVKPSTGAGFRNHPPYLAMTACRQVACLGVAVLGPCHEALGIESCTSNEESKGGCNHWIGWRENLQEAHGFYHQNLQI